MFKYLMVTVLFLVGCSSDPVKDYGPSIVGMQLNGRTVGTGFFIRYEGTQYLVSAKHVCKALESENKQVRFKGDSGEGIAVLVATPKPEGIDICVLLPSEYRTQPLALSRVNPALGEKVVAVGHGGGLGKFEKRGRVITGDVSIPVGVCDPLSNILNVPGCVVQYRNILTSASIIGGHSGSPVLNDSGKVVGVVSTGTPEGIGGIVAVSYLHELLEQLPKSK